MNIASRMLALVTASAVACATGALAPAQPAEPPDPERIIGSLMYPPSNSTAERIQEYREHRALVGETPERFAPILRERLMRGLPATLDEYRVDDPKWAINRTSTGNPNRPASSLLRIVAYLGREHAEPILQDFFDRVNPLAIEARRRMWKAEAEWEGGDEGSLTVRDAQLTHGALWVARESAVKAAIHLESTVFVDATLHMLARDDAAERKEGASLASSYLPEVADQRPDAILRARVLADDLAFSDNPKVAEAGVKLRERLRTVAPFEEAPPPADRPK